MLSLENLHALRRILLHFESTMNEESSRPRADSQDQAIGHPPSLRQDPVTPILPIANSATSYRLSRTRRLLSEQASIIEELQGRDIITTGQRHIQNSGPALVSASSSRRVLESTLFKVILVFLIWVISETINIDVLSLLIGFLLGFLFCKVSVGDFSS